jgi:anti-anti-sigma factor
MNVQIEKHGQTDVLRPAGRLDSATSAVFERAIGGVFDEGSSRMVLDLSQIEYVSSAGLRTTLVAGKRMRSVAGGKLVLCALAPQVREIFEISGFVAIFTISADLETALGLCSAADP